MDGRAVVGVLGPIEILAPVRLSVRSPRKRAVLAGLALGDGRDVSPARLIDLVWGETPPRTAHHALHVYVSELRVLLGSAGAGLVTTPNGYRLDRAIVTTDAAIVGELVGAGRSALVVGRLAEAAEMFESALVSWRGAPFDGVADTDELIAERARLDAVHAGLLDELADVYLALGRHAELIPELEERTRTEPLRERAYEQLMTALYRAGRQADALRVFQRARATLVEQIGVEPGPRLRDLERAVLEHDHSVMLTSRAVVPSGSPDDAGPFVGRLAEVERLITVSLDVASERVTRIMLVGGEPGIGKTRLVDEVAARLGSDRWLVLRGRCPDEGGAPPLWPIAEALRAVDVTGGWLPAGDESTPLARIFRPRDTSYLGRYDPDDILELPPFVVHDAVVDVVVSSVDRPTLLIVDDVHWADEVTLGVLARLAQLAPAVPLLVALTHRVAEVDRSDQFDRAMARLVRERCVDRVALGRLDDVAESQYLRATGMDPSSVEAAWIRARSDGNPLFLRELTRLAAAETPIATLPTGLGQILGARLARVGIAADVLSRAALIGREFEVGVLARLGQDTADDISSALSAGARAGLVGQPAAGVWRFVHALIAEAAAARLDDDTRRRVHLRIAEVLATWPAGNHRRRVTEEARHRVAALPLGDPLLTASACLVAGQASLDGFAYDDAARLFDAARSSMAFGAPDLRLRADALIGHAEALMAAGDGEAARPLLDEALDLVDPATSPALYARGVRVLVLHRSAAGSAGDPELAGLVRMAIDALGPDAGWMGVQLRTDLAMLHYRTDAGAAEALAREALAIADGSGDPLATSFALTGLHQAIWSPDSLGERLDLATRAIATARLSGIDWHESMATAFRGIDRWEQGDLGATERDIAAATELAARGRRPRFLWIARSWSALLDLYRGDVEAAEAGFGEALAAWGSTPNPDALQCFFAQQLTLRLLDGRTSEIIDMLREVAATDPNQTMWHALLSYPLALAGQPGDAGRSLDALMAAGVSSLRRDVTHHVALAMANEAASILGRRDVAADVAELLTPFADRRIVANIFGGGGFCWGSVAHQLGVAAMTLGDLPTARARFRQAVELAKLDSSPTFAARAQRHLDELSATIVER